MNRQKGFVPILIILLGLVVVGGGAWFYIQNNLKDTSEMQSSGIGDLKIYTNKEYGFEFSYPKNLEITKTTYKPDYSLLRVELSNINPSSLITDEEGGEKIIIDVIKSDVVFSYDQESTVLYNKELNSLQVIANETKKITKTISPNLQKSNWMGFAEEDYESARPYLGTVFIPSKNNDFIFAINVSDRNNIENKDLVNNFLNNFKILKK